MSEEKYTPVTPVTVDSLKALVKEAVYHQFEGTTVTVCCIKMTNGFNTIGQSACVIPANFDKEVGERLAFEDAFNKIWQLEGYLLNHKIVSAS